MSSASARGMPRPGYRGPGTGFRGPAGAGAYANQRETRTQAVPGTPYPVPGGASKIRP